MKISAKRSFQRHLNFRSKTEKEDYPQVDMIYLFNLQLRKVILLEEPQVFFARIANHTNKYLGFRRMYLNFICNYDYFNAFLVLSKTIFWGT